MYIGKDKELPRERHYMVTRDGEQTAPNGHPQAKPPSPNTGFLDFLFLFRDAEKFGTGQGLWRHADACHCWGAKKRLRPMRDADS